MNRPCVPIKQIPEKKRILWPSFRVVMVMLIAVAWSVLYVFFATLAMAEPGQVVVQVRATAQVIGNDIYLKDIADITAPVGLKEKAGAIRLGLAPRPGKEKKIPGRRLLSMVQAANVIPPDADITVPESIHIEQACQSVPEGVLQQLYHRSVGEMLEGVEFKVRRVKVCGTNQFPIGTLSFSVSKSGKQEIAGNVNLRVQVRANGETCGRLTLSGWVDRFAPVVCALREVAHHSVLTEADLILTTVNISMLSGEMVTDMADALGKQTRMTLRAGTCLRTGMLTVPPLVKKGDQVKILAGSGRLKVSTMGIAKGSGGKGDQIQVENIVSNKIIVGRVTGKATVEVMF
jgi:flagellar basal body P-ring formation protein FlgA